MTDQPQDPEPITLYRSDGFIVTKIFETIRIDCGDGKPIEFHRDELVELFYALKDELTR